MKAKLENPFSWGGHKLQLRRVQRTEIEPANAALRLGLIPRAVVLQRQNEQKSSETKVAKEETGAPGSKS